MKIQRILFSVLIFLVASCSQLMQEEKIVSESNENSFNKLDLNLNVKRFELQNGLKLLVVENHRLPIFSYWTFFNVGGRYEPKGVTGATHFLEHLMFKGTKNYKFGVFDSAIEGSGGSTNAYTSFDQTVYYQKLPTKMLDSMIKMEKDRMVSLVIENESFEKERGVIFEERKMRYENSPQGKLFLEMMKAIFEHTPYAGSVIGEVSDLKALNISKIEKFYKQFYAPNNAVIVVVGDVVAEDVYEKIKKVYGSIPKSETFQKIKEKQDLAGLYKHQGRYKREINLWGSNPKPILMMGFKGKPLGEKEALVADILTVMLAGSTGSYLQQKYVKTKKAAFTNLRISNYNLVKNGIVFFSGKLMPKTNLRKVKRRLKNEYKNICKKGLSERELLRTKNQFLIEYYKEIQTNSGVASFIGSRESFYGDYSMYQKELEIYKNITLDDVKKTCENIFSSNEYILLTIWNKNKRNSK